MLLNARHIGITVFGLACLLLVAQVIGLAVLMATRQASGESVLTALLALASLGLVVTSYPWTFIGGEKKWVVRAILIARPPLWLGILGFMITGGCMVAGLVLGVSVRRKISG